MENRLSISLSAKVENLSIIRVFVEETGESMGLDEDTIFALVFSVNELATNIIVHGYQEQAGIIEIAMWQDETHISIRLKDQAPPYDPTQAPTPQLGLPLEERRIGGLGVYLSKEHLDDLIYNSPEEGGNELLLVKEVEAG